jgi:hypothetical protein
MIDDTASFFTVCPLPSRSVVISPNLPSPPPLDV